MHGTRVSRAGDGVRDGGGSTSTLKLQVSSCMPSGCCSPKLSMAPTDGYGSLRVSRDANGLPTPRPLAV